MSAVVGRMRWLWSVTVIFSVINIGRANHRGEPWLPWGLISITQLIVVIVAWEEHAKSRSRTT